MVKRNADRPLDVSARDRPFAYVSPPPNSERRQIFRSLGAAGFDPAGFDAAGFEVGTVAAPGIVIRDRNRPMDVS